VQVRYELIYEIKTYSADKNARDGDENAIATAALKRWDNKTYNRRGEHNSRRKGEYNVRKTV
jgi:hypothetical protein